jgi:hypothetical protein
VAVDLVDVGFSLAPLQKPEGEGVTKVVDVKI